MKLNLGENLRRLRREKNMTQEELAERLNVTDRSVSRWETGSAYPDIELLPVLAELFGVTADELIGAHSADPETGSGPDEAYRRLNSTADHKARLALLRELHRDYPKDATFLWDLCGESDTVEEQRRYTKELLAIAGENDRPYVTSAVERMVRTETDETELKALLDRCAADEELTMRRLMEGRYEERQEWDSYERLKQLIGWTALTEGLFPRMVKDWPPKADVSNSLWASGMKLRLIGLLEGDEWDPLHPVSGGHAPDLWIYERLHTGIRYACHLAGSGRCDEALDALEDTVNLYEALYAGHSALQDGQNGQDGVRLKSRCPAFSRLELTVHLHMSRGPEVGEEYARRKNLVAIFYIDGVYEELGWHSQIWPHMELWPLTAEQGWEWFDPIRDTDRWKVCAERMQGFVKTEILDE